MTSAHVRLHLRAGGGTVQCAVLVVHRRQPSPTTPIHEARILRRSHLPIVSCLVSVMPSFSSTLSSLFLLFFFLSSPAPPARLASPRSSPHTTSFPAPTSAPQVEPFPFCRKASQLAFSTPSKHLKSAAAHIRSHRSPSSRARPPHFKPLLPHKPRHLTSRRRRHRSSSSSSRLSR
jgi:hypothetical protein